MMKNSGVEQARMYYPDSLAADSAFEEIPIKEIFIHKESDRRLGSIHVAESVQAVLMPRGAVDINRWRPKDWACSTAFWRARLFKKGPRQGLWLLPGLLLNGINLRQPPDVAFLPSKSSV